MKKLAFAIALTLGLAAFAEDTKAPVGSMETKTETTTKNDAKSSTKDASKDAYKDSAKTDSLDKK